jgi:phospholipid/cholesterol/gamma-HCH transport system ATP-binding protein
METTTQEKKESGSAQAGDSQEQVVMIDKFSKSFGDKQVLKEVSFQIRKAENLVVLGRSGSGKSTLIKCMVRLEEPDQGQICIFGKDMVTVPYDELNGLRTRIGFLFQAGALYDSMTVYENLAFPLRHHKKEYTPEKTDALIKEVLENVGLPDAGNMMPSELSGGMSKRIGLARTLILKPELMLFDEPTTGLDTATTKEICQLIKDMQHKYKISSLIITHDIQCARMTADRIIVLREGSIVAEGSWDELSKSKDEWIHSFFN